MPQKSDPVISLIVPCYNEEAVIDLCHERIVKAIADIQSYTFEIIYINDGSRDDTLAKLKAIQRNTQTARVKIINLSRNFGKEAAMTAGLDLAVGEALIILDADLQDPPELIADMIRIWREEKADVVYGQRITRLGETWLKKFTAATFYRVMNRLTNRVDIPVNTGDFRLMNRKALNALREIRETHRFMKGLFAWIGYKQVALRYIREPRVAGRSKWNYFSLWNLSLEGLTGFSITPLRIASVFGFLISTFAFIFGICIIVHTLSNGSDVPGYPSMIVMISFLSGIQLLTIGILGEYIGRIFNETKKRPLYLVDEVL
jgi:glycosyltransferase involved in cell wall biosynthesis